MMGYPGYAESVPPVNWHLPVNNDTRVDALEKRVKELERILAEHRLV
jgi:hypothetical protein